MAIALVGAAFVGFHLAGVWPRDVVVAYALEAGITEVDVDYVLNGEAVASVRFRQPDGKTQVVQHTVRLRPGEYQAQITVYGSDGVGAEHLRSLVVPTRGATRFDLKTETQGSQ